MPRVWQTSGRWPQEGSAHAAVEDVTVELHVGIRLGCWEVAAGPSARVPEKTGQRESWREWALDKL